MVVVVVMGFESPPCRASDKSLHSRPGSQVTKVPNAQSAEVLAIFGWYLAHPPNLRNFRSKYNMFPRFVGFFLDIL